MPARCEGVPALPLAEVEKLMISRVHEERAVGLFILVAQFERTPDRRIFQLYRKRMACVNNWDLVDLSAPNIVGGWLADKPRDLLDQLATSKVLWYRRIAMVATFHFIRQGEWKDAIRIAERLVNDEHDLIHKAVDGCCGKLKSARARRRSSGSCSGMRRRCRARCSGMRSSG